MKKLSEAIKEHSCYIIAEAGVNHNGRLDLALQLVDAAVYAGADCVKFQTYITEDDVLTSSEAANYQKANQHESSQYKMLKDLELSFDDFRKIKEYCQTKDIQFLSTPFELKSFQFLYDLGTPFWKIPSSDIDNYPLLEAMAKTNLPMIISSGMSDMQELKTIVALLKKWEVKDYAILHCNTEYPTPFQDVNLHAMQTIKETFSCPVGYSDHTLGISVPLAAVALGAVIIEKHFTLGRQLAGPDHKASLEPEELKTMVQSIREVEAALGGKDKLISQSALINRQVSRKSIYASSVIMQGDIFTAANIACKRPAKGISPLNWEKLIGKKAKKSYQKEEPIQQEELL